MKKWKIVLSVAGVFILAYLLVATIAPARLQVERSIQFAVTPDIVFGHVACLNRWADWSSWHDFDPSLKSELSEMSCGEGAWQSWNGERVGMGTRIITELKPNAYIKLDVEYKEISQSGISELFFSPVGEETVLIWKFHANKLPFLYRPINLLTQPVFEEIYEKGLQSLKLLAEREMIPFKLYDYLVDVEEVVLPDQLYLMEITELKKDSLNHFETASATSTALSRFIKKEGIQVGPRTILMMGIRDSTLFRVATAYPVAEPVNVPAPFVCSELTGGRGYQASYENQSVLSKKALLANDGLNTFFDDNDLDIALPYRFVFDKEPDMEDSLGWSVRLIFQVDEGK